MEIEPQIGGGGGGGDVVKKAGMMFLSIGNQ